ncbi:peptidoglycan D,D-transpeptidase FtsI family protein [Pseudalkalibacillus caeni]|uniref:Penicillin-binding protein 2 n=1 Tax=Exobacillus caeni TaxID=2574798 RepID=A0A5R9EYC0_9BACL|nr:penicillin-binding protein 2 [Pseudalkalibacillus caeni]TLS36302.1 penicillin-binding protein 2 [Pseudalkalibacillus caeni]
MGKKKKKSHVPFRLNVLFVFVFVLFSALILRLGVIQIVKGEEYERVTEQTENVTAKSSAPRGKMYDRYGRVVVDNEPVFSLTYIKTKGNNQDERLNIANKLADFISKDTKELTERDLKDYWILTRQEKAKAKLTEEEWKKYESGEAYQLQLDRISKDDLEEITESELEAAAIKRAMDSGYALSSQTIKKGLTREEIAVISENLAELPGVDIQADSERKYPYSDTMKTLFGNLGQIPKETIDYYIARDYDRNDEIGISFLEAEYEELLRGKKTKRKYITDKAGNPIGDPETIEGQRGNDLVLSVDIELQQAVEQVLEEEIKKARAEGNPSLDRAYVVMMDPNTGEILSMAGKELTQDGFVNRSFGAINDAYEMGSAVKGATVLTGFQYNVINPGTVLLDTPLYFPGTPTKKSYVTMGSINDLTALQRSSNVYMFRIAMMLGNHNYVPRQGGSYDPNAYNKMRESFSQFGLGIETGIDLPGEGTGYNGGVQRLGNLLDLAIGQFDTYTPLQMVQYISTIANGGYRIQPHFLKEIREPTEGDQLSKNVMYQYEPKVLNRIKMDKSYIERVQQGLWMVMNTSRGTAAHYFEGAEYSPAGKTGTAQVGDNYNLTLVGYAPSTEPEVAFSVVVPNIDHEHGINKYISRRILDKYFELKESGRNVSKRYIGVSNLED